MNEEGDRVKARRERLGMEKIALARAAGIHRNTLAALESGESYNRSTLRKVEQALNEAEHEAGIGAPPVGSSPESPGTHMVTIRRSQGDVDIVVEGPIDDLDALSATVERLLRSEQRAQGQNE